MLGICVSGCKLLLGGRLGITELLDVRRVAWHGLAVRNDYLASMVHGPALFVEAWLATSTSPCMVAFVLRVIGE